jgi:hypothetical protein
MGARLSRGTKIQGVADARLEGLCAPRFITVADYCDANATYSAARCNKAYVL